MKHFAFMALVAARILAPSVSAAQQCPEPAAAGRVALSAPHVAASLTMPSRLTPPSYLSLVVVDRPRSAYERYRDPNVEKYHEYGLWKLLAPINIDVLAVVIPWDAPSFALLLDNFAVPSAGTGKIDAAPMLRALGIR